MINILNILKNNNHANLFVYGNNSYEFIINKIYKTNKIKLNETFINKIKYNYFTLHYEFDCNLYSINDICKSICELGKIKTINNFNYYIILKNYDIKYYKYSIKNILDICKYKYIICSDYYNIDNVIKSRVLIYKVLTVNKNINIIKCLNLKIYEIYKKCKLNILLTFLEENVKYMISLNIKLKDIIKNLCKLFLPKSFILNKSKYKLLQTYSNIEYNYNKSYNKLIYYEYTYIATYNTIYNDIYCYFKI